MQDRFDRILEGLLPERGAVLLAVSGGIDSMCMADLFLNSRLHPRFAVAHCNFHLRGNDSDLDEALVEEWAGAHGIIFIKKDFDTEGYAASSGLSIEMAARELRYAWFAEVCRREGFSALSVAHNANDDAETMVLNLLRGTGVKGVTGMRRSSALPGSEALLVRPLLDFSRKDINEYALSRGLVWREDRTNADSAYKRNCIRNEVFPIFARINPSFLATLKGDMARFAQVQAIADNHFRAVEAAAVSLSGDGLPAIDIRRLTENGHWEYALFRLLEPYGFTSSAIGDIADLLKNGSTVSGRRFLSGEYQALTDSGTLRLTRRFPNGGPEPQELSVEGPGTYSLGDTGFTVSLSGDADDVFTSPGETKFDSAAIPFPFTVRRWRAGDWMRPLGMKGRRKLSDIFVDLKTGLSGKEKALVVSGEGSHVLALVGSRIDDSVKVTKATASVTVIRLI